MIAVVVGQTLVDVDALAGECRGLAVSVDPTVLAGTEETAQTVGTSGILVTHISSGTLVNVLAGGSVTTPAVVALAREGTNTVGTRGVIVTVAVSEHTRRYFDSEAITLVTSIACTSVRSLVVSTSGVGITFVCVVGTLVDVCAGLAVTSPALIASTLEGTNTVVTRGVDVAGIEFVALVDIGTGVAVSLVTFDTGAAVASWLVGALGIAAASVGLISGTLVVVQHSTPSFAPAVYPLMQVQVNPPLVSEQMAWENSCSDQSWHTRQCSRTVLRRQSNRRYIRS